MGRKVFVSYKYNDSNVQNLPGVGLLTKVRDYVDYIERKIIGNSRDIYKGEESNEDLSGYSEAYIWNHLKDKIFDSSLTIVLISPNMKEPNRWQRSQWIPWEISYSLRDVPRRNQTSHNNAVLAVILPNSFGNYSYYNKNNLFPILRDNINNGYIYVVKWYDFIRYPQIYFELAFDYRKNTPAYKIVKNL